MCHVRIDFASLFRLSHSSAGRPYHLSSSPASLKTVFRRRIVGLLENARLVFIYCFIKGHAHRYKRQLKMLFKD